MGDNHIEPIIRAYNQANTDAIEILNYLNSINDPAQLEMSQLPSLVNDLENTNSVASQNYINGASVVGGSVAVAVGTSISSSTIIGGMGAALGGAGIIGAKFVPLLGWYVIPVMGVQLTLKLMKDAKIRKYLKDNSAILKKNKKEIEKQKERLLKWFSNLQEQSIDLDRQIKKNFEVKYEEYKEKTKKFASDVSVQIDDFLNSNTNKRIFQYNEVILNQYRLQKVLEDKVEFMFGEYNKLQNSKQELERQINCLMKLLNAMNCPEAIIDQALNESGGVS